MSEESEKLQGTIAGQAFSLQARDLLPILLLLAGLVGGYLIWVQMDKRFELFQQHHLKTFELLLAEKEFVRQESDKLTRLLYIVNYNLGRSPEDHLPMGLNGLPGETQRPPSP